MSSSEQLRQIVGSVIDPTLARSLADLKMVSGVALEGGVAKVSLTLPTHAYPHRDQLKSLIEGRLKEADAAVESVDVEFDVRVEGQNSGGTIGLNVKNVIAVGSGKGGVGKSSIAASLAFGLQHYGAKVGLLDADVYGPSIPHLLGASGQPTVEQKQNPDGTFVDRIQPIQAKGMPLMSIGFMVPSDQAVIWRGPMLHKLLTQFLAETDWGSLDYLIVDMPPGTGDVALTLSQMLGLAGAVVVCTPQKVALLDAVKAINMYRKLEIPVLGIVENMSGEIFGRGGAAKKAEEMDLACLGEVPSIAAIRELADEGCIDEVYKEGCPARAPLLNVVQNSAMQIVKNLAGRPKRPTLEIIQ